MAEMDKTLYALQLLGRRTTDNAAGQEITSTGDGLCARADSAPAPAAPTQTRVEQIARYMESLENFDDAKFLRRLEALVHRQQEALRDLANACDTHERNSNGTQMGVRNPEKEYGGIGINCGGHVFVKPIRAWHDLALRAIEQRGAAGNIESRTESPYNGASSTFEAGGTAAPHQNSAAHAPKQHKVGPRVVDQLLASAEPESEQHQRVISSLASGDDIAPPGATPSSLEQQATTRGKPETVSDTAPVPAVSDPEMAECLQWLARDPLNPWATRTYVLIEHLAAKPRDPEYLECCALRKAAERERDGYVELLWQLYEGIYGHRKAEGINPFSTAVNGALELKKAWYERGYPAESRVAGLNDLLASTILERDDATGAFVSMQNKIDDAKHVIDTLSRNLGAANTRVLAAEQDAVLIAAASAELML